MASNALGDPAELAIECLTAFINTSIPALAVKNEWPYANEKLAYPTCTATLIGTPKRMPEMPYQVSITEPDEDFKVITNEVVASWDFSVQLDLWCKDKLQRRQYTDMLIALFNSQEMDLTGKDNPDGLSLTCAAMFNEVVRYEIDTIQAMDDERAAQTQERREKIAVLVNFREVRQRTYYAMSTIELHSDVSPTDPITDNDDNTEVTEI